MINVNTLVVFLFFTYTTKLKSIVQFKGAITSDCGNYLRMDVWNNPKTSDFLHTLKFESFNIKMNLTDLLMAIYLCFRISLDDDNFGRVSIIGFALVNLVQYPILIMSITKSYEESSCKKCLIITFGIMIAFIYLDMGMMFLMEFDSFSKHPENMIFLLWYEY